MRLLIGDKFVARMIAQLRSRQSFTNGQLYAGSDMRCLAIASGLSLLAATAYAADAGHHGAGMHGHGPMRGDELGTMAPVVTSPAATAAPSTAPASHFNARGPSDLYVRKVPAGVMPESYAQWQARCVDHEDKDPITLVSIYRYKAGVVDCP
jgi:hypothetical protein